MKVAGVLPNMVMIFAQMNEPLGARFRVGQAAFVKIAHMCPHFLISIEPMDNKIVFSLI
jgi:hypothetical protein